MTNKFAFKPFQDFLKTESLSGFLLFGATLFALVLANSPYATSYSDLWQQEIGFHFMDFGIQKALILWINDGLMAIFFFLIGLEIKREIMIGELNSVKKAAFPLMGALGGMLFPMAIYLLLNKNPETASGWGIPMATDIAFTLAIIKLLGKRVPLSLKIFLTAFAIVDDLGAVLVIAIFYSSNLNIMLLVYALAIIGVLLLFSRAKKYNKHLYFIVGIVVWFLFLKSGIHPTIAGVLMAFTIPIHTKINTDRFTKTLPTVIEKFKMADSSSQLILTNEQIEHLDELDSCIEEVQSPLQHLEHRLHHWVAYFIMPIFAFANAGVALTSDVPLDSSLMLVLSVSLIGGNLLGISIMTYIGHKLRWISIPKEINAWQIIGISLLAGLGFTMSIFISNLAFTEAHHIDSAKAGIIIASAFAALLGFIILRWSSLYTTDNE